MNMGKNIFKTCADVEVKGCSLNGTSIFFVCPKGLDLSFFAVLQGLASLTGLKFGDYELSPSSNVLFVDGYRSATALKEDFATCEYATDLSKIKILSMVTYNDESKASSLDPEVSVVDASIVDKMVEYAKSEGNLCVIFYDLHSLRVGKSICKASDFTTVHSRLKDQGAIQLYFVNSEAEAMQVAVKPDLVFLITKVNGAGNPTIRLSLNTAKARVQDSILPINLELIFSQGGSWKVETSMSRADQDEAIRALKKLDYTHKEIAAALKDISAATICRRLQVMKEKEDEYKKPVLAQVL